MRKLLLAVVIVLLSLEISEVDAAEPILVLVARGPGVSSSAALSVLTQINQLTDQSELGDRNFQNAGDHMGAPLKTVTSSCSNSNATLLLACVMNDDPNVFDVPDERDAFDADIVIFVVTSVNTAVCGITPADMINLPIISPINRPLGYAAVGLTCNVPGTFFAASHEVLHLLSIEHKNGDGDLDDPERDNHAFSAVNQVTAGGAPSDCVPDCNSALNKMSSPNDTFPNSFPMGNTLHANARSVVGDHSWDAVAAYRPIPSPPNCTIIVTEECPSGDFFATLLLTPQLSGYTVTNMLLEQDSILGGWQTIFSGGLNCIGYQPFLPTHLRAILTLAIGLTSECDVWVGPGTCPQ